MYTPAIWTTLGIDPPSTDGRNKLPDGEDMTVESVVKIHCCFPGVGRTYLMDEYSMVANIVNLNPDTTQENYVDAYIEDILEAEKSYDYVLVNTYPEVRRALKEKGINYNVVYPSINQRKQYYDRYTNKGKSIQYAETMIKNWRNLINELDSDQDAIILYTLQSNEYLSSVFL